METNIDFMKNAFQALVDRKVIKADLLEESAVTDEMLRKLEEELDVTIPQEVCDYVKAYSHSMDMLCAAVMDDRDDTEFLHQVRDMTQDEIDGLDEDEVPYLEAIWSNILPVPKTNPLEELKNAILGFREYADIIEDDAVSEESLKKFVVVGDWMSAGPICIDTTKKKEDIDLDDPDTWQLRWFDHEEFDWAEEGYLDDEGNVVGSAFLPDFETFIKLYFYGVYDTWFERQCEDEGEDKPDRSQWYKLI